MAKIDVGDEADARQGLVTLVVTVVELLVEALEREAVRRMDSGKLSDEDVERLGSQLARIEAEIEQLKRDEGIEEGVADLRGDLDGLVADAIERFDDPEASGPGYTVYGGDEE
ncbi:gas vesicle protein K [Salinilacihabitans rarus]|uniref:gas vesicle protein K n=1 Tax=Salinilacihabitans rarus TaxID=2961596 RepID=UPI0020C85D41|nr:gas vesicle protein K [Salinilacihabitans rarus]